MPCLNPRGQASTACPPYAWHLMLPWARAYWQEVMNHPLASPALAAIGARQLGWLNTAVEQNGKAGGELPQV